MSYYNDKTLLFPIKEGPHLDNATLRDTLRDPEFMKKSLESIGFPQSDTLTLAQLKGLCSNLRQDKMMDLILPLLKEFMDKDGKFSTTKLAELLSSGAFLDLDKAMPINERLRAVFHYISQGKPEMTALEIYKQLEAKVGTAGGFDLKMLEKYAEASEEKFNFFAVKRYLREYQFNQTHK